MTLLNRCEKPPEAFFVFDPEASRTENNIPKGRLKMRGRLFQAATALGLTAGLACQAQAQAFTENFDDIDTLAGNGWLLQNNSSPVGSLGWFQGTATSATPTPGPFNSYNGTDNAYIAANYNSTGSTGTISNWLITPNRTLRNGDVLTFYTRKPTISGGMTDYPDRLEVRLSTNGASTNAGSNATTVGDFTTLLLSVNPALVANVYPQVWTRYTVTISGLPAPTSGRTAFRYFVTGAGSLGSNSDYIGIDNVVYTPYLCPALTLTGTTGAGAWGQSYNAALGQTGALGAPNFAVTAGALPPGLTLASSGTVSGVPTGLGTFNFTVTVSDASGCSGSQAYSIQVDPVVPGAPQNVTAIATTGQATVSWDAPASDGGAAISSYTVTSSPGGISMTASSSPITISGLTNGTSYTFTVAATNSVGSGATSASNAVTPTAPAATVSSIPTLSEWGLIGMSFILSLFGLSRVHRQGHGRARS